MRNENSKTNQGGYTISKKRVYPCTCSNCNKNFDGPANGTKFCSDECKLEFRIKEHPNNGLCLQCNTKIDKKKLLNGSKFCSNSCSSKYNNAHRTQEEKERIANICRDYQTKIMNSLSEEDMNKRVAKANKTKSEWSEERKQEHSKLLSENARRQFEKETSEEKELRYRKVSQTLISKTKEEKEKISQKIKDSYYSKTEEEKNIIKDKIKNTRENYSEEKKESISKKCSKNAKELWKNRTEEQKKEIGDKIREKKNNLFIEERPNSENFNTYYVRENFIEDGLFKIREFAEYFGILSLKGAMRSKDKLGITEPNKRLKTKTQTKLFMDIPSENKILNYRKLIFPQEVDIYLPDIKLAIEYDGLMFHSQGKSQYSLFKGVSEDYHLEKTNLVESKGAQLFHIFEGEDLDIWTSMIKNKLGLNTRIYARKCLVKEVSSQEARKFLEDNHLQGYANSKVRLGLFYNEELVSLMTFSKPRYTKNYDWELVRFCTLKGYNVVGGVSKLLSSFRSNYKGSIISYANRRWSNGDLYRRLGFKEISRTSPGYFYFKESEMILYTRDKFQKHKLKDLLETFDENLTEEENMFENEYRKIYDCGNLVFVLEDR